MARKASPATRRTGIRLDPVRDGVVRTPAERSVTAIPFHVTVMETDIVTGRERRMPERATLATERARSSSDEPAAIRAPRTASVDTTGRPYTFQTDMFGNKINLRAERLTTDPDGPLIGRIAARPKRVRCSDPRPTGRTAGKRATIDPDARPVAPRTPVADIDAMIRATGYTGPINKIMRGLARDAMSHAASVAAYVGSN